MDTEYVEISVHGGFKTIIDASSVALRRDKKLYLNGNPIKYVSFSSCGKIISLSRFLLHAGKGDIVDHLNGNVLDNRIENLRLSTVSLNKRNSHQIVRSSCGFRGVCKKLKRYRAFTKDMNLFINLGCYSNPLIASIFRDSFIMSGFGKYSGLNFQESISQDSLESFLEKTKGRIFRCWFVKRKDGAIRSILCRTGVHKNLKNKGLAYNPSEKNLVLVYDLSFHNYRFIPMENILCLKFKNVNYKVIRPRLSLAA
jgi:hypothetical protein